MKQSTEIKAQIHAMLTKPSNDKLINFPEPIAKVNSDPKPQIERQRSSKRIQEMKLKVPVKEKTPEPKKEPKKEDKVVTNILSNDVKQLELNMAFEKDKKKQ